MKDITADRAVFFGSGLASGFVFRQFVGIVAFARWPIGPRLWARLIESYSPSISPLADSASDYM